MAEKFVITDEMVALEYQRLTGKSFEIAEIFAKQLRSEALMRAINYTVPFDQFARDYIKPEVKQNLNGYGDGNVRKLGDAKRKAPVRLNRWEPMVATPAYDNKVDSEFAHALAESAYCCPAFDVHLTFTIMRGGAFIDLTRNILARMFLQDEAFASCTHLFFIDGDLKWSPNAFVGLVRSDLPICAGVYPKRQDTVEYPVRFAEHPEKGGLWVEEEEDGFQWIMGDRVPTGFLCIRRDIVEELAAEADQLDIHGQDGPVPDLFQTTLVDADDVRFPGSKRYVGEDYAFCDRYRAKYGKPIHIWPDIDFVHGGHKGNLLEYLESEIGKEEAMKSVVGVGLDG